MTPIIKQVSDHSAVIELAAEMLSNEITGVVRETGRCRIALSGGETPRDLYARLTKPPWSTTTPWSQTVWFFGDERWISHTDPLSTARMVTDTLFQRVPIPRQQVHLVPTDAANPCSTAEAYEATLRTEFGETEWPIFDVALMGLGRDGHTASLFPGDRALSERTTWVTTTRAGNPVPDRITLTPPVFTHTRVMVFLVSGSSKASAVATTLEGPRDPLQFPAQAVQPVSGRCIWILDRAAASQLKHTSRS